MKLAYVCTNYNNSSFTLAAVESLLLNVGHDIEVFVVDNASAEEEVRKLRPLAAKYSSVHILESHENIGYFGGLNLGLKALREKRPDIEWVVAGNNDLEFSEDFCDVLWHNAHALQQHSVISPDVITLDGEHQNPHVIASISTIREVLYDLYYSNYHLGRFIHKVAKMFPRVSERSDEEQWQVAQPIYQGHGSCYVLGPRFFRQFKEFWAPTFMMSEEFFLSKQLKEVGEQVWYEPKIRIIHHWHGALEQLPSRRRWEMARDAHREYRKYIKIFRRD
ncbi:MAG: glycosyltransferase [Burkholderiaceae bacterium]